MKVFCMGDSLTAGSPFSEEFSWPSLIAKDTGYEMINMGIDGETSKQIMDRVLEDDRFKNNTEKSLGIIMCGSNDFIFRKSPISYVINNILTMCKECKKRNIEPIIGSSIICNPEEATAFWIQYPFVNFKKVNGKIIELRNEIKKICEKNNIGYIDLQDKYRDFYQFSDGVHPTKEGYRILANEIENYLTNLVK